MSSNDKTSDLLVATTRATKADTVADGSVEKPAAMEQQPVAKKAPVKKAVARKKSPAKKTAVKKTPAKKGAAGSQKEELVVTFTFGRRVWPD